MGDGAEVFHGRDPTDPDSYATLPFVENFETNTVIVGTLDGQHGWTAGPPSLVVVQTAEVHAGEQAAKLGSPTNVTLATAEHLLAGSGQSVVWCDAYMRVTPSVAPDGGLADSAALFFAGDGRLVVQDGHYSGDARWVSVDPRMTLNTGDWVRVTVKLDYGAQEWAVCLSNLVVADHLGFGAGAAEFSAVAVDARHGYADTLSLSTNMPAGLSMDWDQLPDEWELEQFGDLDEDDAGDPDYDGLSNLGEYEAGADPLNWDSDGDGLGDWYELYHAGTDPLDEDSDDDGLGDAWEHWYGLAANDPENPDDPDDDPDGDDLTNAQEEALGTNPFLADSDGDGVDDDSDANPLVADQGSDPGGPALTVTYPEEGQYILW
jgi:hypothetical protein